MILIISSEHDVHARVVARLLEDRGLSVVIADVAELGNGAEIDFHPGDVGASTWRRKNGSAFSLGTVEAVWLRRQFFPVPPTEVMDLVERDLIQRQWKEMIFGVFESMAVPLINNPRSDMFATKPLQLVLARRLGLPVPDTLVTNRPLAAREFVDAHGADVIHKVLRPSNLLLDTKRWDEHDDAALDTLRLAPAIFQARVRGKKELRITVVDRQLFAAEHETHFIDGRLDHASQYRPHVLPEGLSAQLLELVDALGLSYASIDMRCDENGEYSFLEVTPQGQFLWIEIQTGLPISAAMADLLEKSSKSHPRNVEERRSA